MKPYYLVILILVSYTLFGFPILGGIFPFHIILFLAFALLPFLILSPYPTFYSRIPPLLIKFALLYLAFLGILWLSSSRAIDIEKATVLLRSYIGNLLLIVVIAITIRREGSLRSVVNALIVITSIGSMLTLLQTFFSLKISPAYIFMERESFERLVYAPVGYAHMTYKLGNDLLVGFLPTLALYLSTGAISRRECRLFLATLFLITAGLILSRSASSILGALAGSSYITFKQKRLRIATIVLFFLIFMSMWIIPLLMWQRYTTLYSAERRINLLSAGIEMFKTSPIFGIGLSNFGGSHNVVLGILVENGVVGALLYMAILWYAFQACNSSKIGSNMPYLKAVSMGLEATLIGYLIDSLFHNYFFDNHLWFIIGLCISVGTIRLRCKSFDYFGGHYENPSPNQHPLHRGG